MPTTQKDLVLKISKNNLSFHQFNWLKFLHFFYLLIKISLFFYDYKKLYLGIIKIHTIYLYLYIRLLFHIILHITHSKWFMCVYDPTRKWLYRFKTLTIINLTWWHAHPFWAKEDVGNCRFYPFELILVHRPRKIFTNNILKWWSKPKISFLCWAGLMLILLQGKERKR